MNDMGTSTYDGVIQGNPKNTNQYDSPYVAVPRLLSVPCIGKYRRKSDVPALQRIDAAPIVSVQRRSESKQLIFPHTPGVFLCRSSLHLSLIKHALGKRTPVTIRRNCGSAKSDRGQRRLCHTAPPDSATSLTSLSSSSKLCRRKGVPTLLPDSSSPCLLERPLSGRGLW